MSNFTDFFPAAGGGGGGIPKYQDFITSGTFTPTQALIDAGGRVSYFVVAGGQQGTNASTQPSLGGSGGEVEYGYMTLTSTTGCLVTIGAGGASLNAVGGNSSAIFSSAGGTDVIASGGAGDATGRNFGAKWYSGRGYSTAFSGVGNYGKGGGSSYDGGGVNVPLPNSGGGSRANAQAGSGFVRITWFE